MSAGLLTLVTIHMCLLGRLVLYFVSSVRGSHVHEHNRKAAYRSWFRAVRFASTAILATSAQRRLKMVSIKI